MFFATREQFACMRDASSGFLSWRCFCTHTHLYLYLQLHLHTYLYLCLYLHVNLAWVVCVCLAFVGLTAKVCLSNRKLEKRCVSCEWSSSLDRFKDLKGNILECNYINMYALPRFLFRQVLALKFALITQIYMAFVASAPKLRCPIPSTHLFPDKCPISGSLNRSQFVLPPLHLYLHLIFACLFAFLCSAPNPLCGVFVLSEWCKFDALI